jgi:hypothetical protein
VLKNYNTISHDLLSNPRVETLRTGFWKELSLNKNRCDYKKRSYNKPYLIHIFFFFLTAAASSVFLYVGRLSVSLNLSVKKMVAFLVFLEQKKYVSIQAKNE